jgi:hypothetical protein
LGAVSLRRGAHLWLSEAEKNINAIFGIIGLGGNSFQVFESKVPILQNIPE